ncbi:putative nucleoside hydrolase [Xylogone sp. PMI_703]|nr:putative nucleoside hydrolase [Xylogone sp. PMI_703]
MAPRKIIIDTDPGVDDILAILLAFSALPEKLQVLLISVTYGNIDVQNCLRNVISLFYHVEKEIAWRESVGRSSGFETIRKSKPIVAVGPEHPLADNTLMADFFHGRDALSGIHLSHPHLTPAETWERLLEETEKSSTPEQVEIAEEMNKTASLFTRSQTPAHLEILKLLHDNEPNSITIVAIGPLTNLALAAAEDPETFLKVKEVVVMGGNIDQTGNVGYQSLSHLQQVPNVHEPPFRLIKQAPGRIRDSLNIRNQVTPLAEFNTYADPIAAARVYALTSPKPHTTMPPIPPAPLSQGRDVSPPWFLSSYPDNLSKQLKVTLFPVDITGKHVLTRGDFEASLQPQLAAKSPLAEWVSAFMNASFEKVESLRPEISRDAVGLQLHDPLTIWYCMDDDNPKWEIIEGEDLRVEIAGQWTGGMLVTDRRRRKQKDDYDYSEAPEDTDGWLTEGNGNRVSRCVGSPGEVYLVDFCLNEFLAAETFNAAEILEHTEPQSYEIL